MPIQLRLEYLTLIIPALILWCLLVYRWRYWVLSFLQSHLAFLTRSIRFSPAIGLMAIPIVWLGATHHFEYDEAKTFLSFTTRSIFRAIAYYPSPNNHVLHSVLTNITWHGLGWTHSELSVRLPAILFSLITAAFVSNVFLKGNRPLTILFITVLFVSHSFFTMSFQARSYSMQSFFAMVGLWSVMGMRDTATDRRLATLVLSCILGTYSSPAFLYTVFPLFVMFLVCNREWVLAHPKQAITISLAGISSVVLLYSPILLVESVKAVTSNRFVKPHLDFMPNDFIRHCSGIVKWVILPGAAGFTFLGLTYFHALRKKRFDWLAFILCPILMMCLLRQMPDFRVFQPVGVIILVLGLLCFVEWLGSVPFKPWAMAVSVSLLATTAAYRIRTAHELPSLRADLTYGAIERHLPKEGDNYLLKTPWIYSDPLLAYSKVRGREYLQLPDTTTRLPSSGMLVTGKRMPELKCTDSILNMEFSKFGTLYIYSLDGRLY